MKAIKIKDYIQPFEKRLALMELKALSQNFNAELLGDNLYALSNECSLEVLADKLAYWEYINDGHTTLYTKQSRLEATTNIVRSNLPINEFKYMFPFTKNIILPRRRCLRYGTHGIHEYRGKFFPQLVRSLINISQIRDGDIVGDPMMGSGTTLVEALLSKKKCIASDLNPLSVFIAKTKAEILTIPPDTIINEYTRIKKNLLREPEKKYMQYFTALGENDQKYLLNWFSHQVLASLDQIISTVLKVDTVEVKNLLIVSLSNIIRNVSWQKNEDLRVRKDVRLDEIINPIKIFLEEAERSIRFILAFLYEHGPLQNSCFLVLKNDARLCGDFFGRNTIDLVITSPPYATALPYLDTDRLSLYFLRMLSRHEHRKLDKEMIGNREINEKIRLEYITNFYENSEVLPQSVQDLIIRIDSINSKGSVGFRRKNLPALLSKYFFDMRYVLQGIHYSLKPGGSAYIIIGDNHTVAGGRRIEINTASLLQDIAKTVGFSLGSPISMEVLKSRDIHRKNAMTSEKILFLRKDD